MAKLTREDVAREAQVSGATVSRVLSGRQDLQISDEMKRRVLAAAERLGYLPNPAAKALLTGRTQLVGLWMCLGFSYYRGQVLDQMRSIVADTDFALAVTDVEEDLFWRHSMARALRLAVDGIIAFDTPTAGDAFTRSDKNQAGTTPFVGMGAYWSGATSYVGVDLGSGVRDAIRHLRETGRKQVAYFHPGEHIAPSEARAKAYVESASSEPLFIPNSGLSIAESTRRLSEFLASSRPPESILCFNDEIAIGACQALLERGLEPGRDVAIVGCDGIAAGELLPYPITTIAQPVFRMCSAAWEFMRERIDQPEAPLRQIVLQPELIVRSTTRTVPTMPSSR